MKPAQVSRVVRRGILVLSALGIVYLFWRFDLQTLPAERCSPLTRFSAGDQLVIDRRPGALEVGNALLGRDAIGTLHLGVVERVRAEDGALWFQTDVLDCPAPDSDEFGWVAAEDVTGRVVLVWPW